jgi:carbon starvation protein
MNSTIIALLALVIYLVFYFSFGKRLQTKLCKSQDAPDAPSKRLSDGVDYVPTSKYVLFGHHFASIAGAGPITGPAIAIVWGWLPGLLWVWFGNIFVGAIHDYLALVASVRYDGRSVQYVAQDLMGKRAGKSFGWFILFLCILVVAAFGDIVAGQFAGGNGEVASTFFLFCAAAIILGILMYRTKLGVGLSTLIGIVLLTGAFALGGKYGIPGVGKPVWFLVIFVYVVIASAMPVNILLQPRDYLNSFLLYFGLVLGGIAAIISFKGMDAVPVVTTFSAPAIGGHPSPFWPTIPLVIACGALSGFHALVASGTSSKQLRDEKDALFIGYGAMLTEGFLSTLVVVSIAGFGLSAFPDAATIMKTGAIPRFTQSFGAMVNSGLGISKEFMTLFAAIWVSSFALTTLDTTNRLGRYIIGELALPLKEKNAGLFSIFANKWLASIIMAVLGIGLAFTGGYEILWPAFAGANQLIASIVMVTIALWVKKKMNAKYTNLVLIPAILLWVTITAGVIWYSIVVVPDLFTTLGTNAVNIRQVITGVVVGIINLIMLILNFITIIEFLRNFGKDKGVVAAQNA